MWRSLLLLFVITTLYCCGAPDVVNSQTELVSVIQEDRSGLKKTLVIDEYKLDVLYKPVDLMVSEHIGDSLINRERLALLRKRYGNYDYFILSLSRNSKEALHNADGGLEQYSSLVQTLSFRMNEYVTLTTNTSDTIPMADFILNRTYGISSSTDLLFAFNKVRSPKSEWIQFNLNEFGLGIGNQRFRFMCEDLNDAPTIDFNTSN